MTPPAPGYDDIAAEYDAAFAWESDPGVILPVWAHLGRPSRVIEFGCGPARLLSTLVANGVSGIGVDISGPMLDLARGYLESTGGTFELHRANLSSKPMFPAAAHSVRWARSGTSARERPRWRI